jgi:DNA-cytosine methyltransferase
MKQHIHLKVGELFAGAGGLSLGFILADHPVINYRPVFAIDNDTPSLNSYRSNMVWLHEHAPEVLPEIPGVFKRNVEKLNVTAVLRLLKLKQGELDLLLGGPPCQGFSTSNRSRKAQSKEDRNRLINIFLDKLAEFFPKMFLIENVQGVQWTQPTQDMELPLIQDSLFPELKAEIKPRSVEEFLVHKANNIGYYVWKNVLDAVDFGVPQHRMRFFLFGIRKDLIESKDSINLDKYLNTLKSLEKVSVSNAIDDLPELENGQSWQGEGYHPSDNEYIRKLRLYMENGDLYDHMTTRHAPYVIERYKKIPEGGNWKSIKDEMLNYKLVDNTHNNIYRRLLSNNPANTISHYRKSMIIHPKQHRGLSFREACRLQSFPDWCRFDGTLNDKQQQLANAVPPLMASAVANAIGEFLINLKKT